MLLDAFGLRLETVARLDLTIDIVNRVEQAQTLLAVPIDYLVILFHLPNIASVEKSDAHDAVHHLHFVVLLGRVLHSDQAHVPTRLSVNQTPYILSTLY